MHIEGIDAALLRRAVQIYLDHAWGAHPKRPKVPPAIADGASLDAALAAFHRDQRAGTMRKFTLRLGNDRYPFMKLVFQELIVRDRFFFAVDTHDELDLKDSFPDYEQWLELKRRNRELRDAIEASWRAAAVPTFQDVVSEVERETPPGPAVHSGAPMVLIVDDDRSIAVAVHTILSRHGYRTAMVTSGEEALDFLGTERPDLILSDLEMGGMSGLDLAARLRASEPARAIPFILATAASISPTNFHVIDGFLVKPYDGDLLLKFVATHLSRPADGGRGSAGTESAP